MITTVYSMKILQQNRICIIFFTFSTLIVECVNSGQKLGIIKQRGEQSVAIRSSIVIYRLGIYVYTYKYICIFHYHIYIFEHFNNISNLLSWIAKKTIVTSAYWFLCTIYAYVYNNLYTYIYIVYEIAEPI